MSQERITELLEEILLWTKYDYSDTKEKMLQHLDTDDKKIAYELSDGENSTYDIQKYVSVSQRTISSWWRNWFELGLMEQTEKLGKGGRHKRLISLIKMRIPFPEIVKKVVENEQ